VSRGTFFKGDGEGHDMMMVESGRLRAEASCEDMPGSIRDQLGKSRHARGGV